MRTFFADEPVSLLVPLIVGGDYVLPDTGSVTWTLRYHNGTVALADQPVASATSVLLQLASEYQTITREIENRFVTVKFTISGTPHRIDLSYRLVSFLPLTVTPADVRTYLGLDQEELPDEMVDVLGAYLTCKARVPQLETFLVEDPLPAHDLVRAMAALQVADTLPVRVMQSQRSDSNQMTRFRVDFGVLRKRAEDDIDRLVAHLTEAEQFAFEFVRLGTVIDAVTGE